MTTDYIALTPEGLTRGVSIQDAYFLILREKDGHRFLPTLLEESEYKQILLALEKKEYPRTNLMSRLAQRMGHELECTHLFYTTPGKLNATLIFKTGDETVSLTCNFIDGITAALENECPILMGREMFEAQTLNNKGEGQVSMPITAMNRRLLQQALEAAVAEENFELASSIRDEIKRRDQVNGNPGNSVK